ncbi:MAG: translocation/assembly module TamB domain-containing protein [Vicinamibacterales bacterium]
MSVVRRSLQVVALVCTLLVGMASMAVIVTQTAWFKQWMRSFIVRQAANYLNGDLSIGRLDGNLFFGVELEDVGVTLDGKPVVHVENVGLDYDAFALLRGEVVLDEIRLNRPAFRLERTDEGWNLARLIKVRTPPAPSRRRRAFAIGAISISGGTLYFNDRTVGTRGAVVPSRIERLDASVGVRRNEDALTIDIAHVSLRAEAPHLGVNALSGTIVQTDEGVVFENMSLRTEESSLRVDGTIRTGEGGRRVIALNASSSKLATDEIGRVVPALRGYGLRPAFEVSAQGPLERLSVDVNVQDATLGHVAGDLTVDAAGPDRAVAGAVSMARFNFAPLTAPHTVGPGAIPASAFTSDITGEAQIDLALPTGEAPLRGTYALDLEHATEAGYEAQHLVAHGRIDGRVIQVDGSANAYGGRVSATGTFVVRRPVVLDLAGYAAGVDLRNVPPSLRMPVVPSDLQFYWTLTSQDGEYTTGAEFDASTMTGASIEPGTTGQVTFGRSAPVYTAQGQVADLDVQQIGEGFGVDALATDRFRSRVTAAFEVTGSGGGHYPFTLDATGTASDSVLFGATFPRLDVAARVDGGDMNGRARGEFGGFNPAVPSDEEEVAGDLNGTLDVEATLRNYASGITVDSLDVSGRVNLANSTLAGLVIDRASIEGTYAKREGELARFEVTGPDLTASGRGPIALNETGASRLEAHVESPSLEQVGKVFGWPLKGGATIDATMTGNARALNVKGTLQGTNIGYRDTRALTLASTFDATVPELSLKKATITALSTATLLEVAGRHVRQLAADTTYARSQLEFNAVAQEGERELAAAGSAVLHPDHQDVHLGHMVLRSGKVEWRTVPGSTAAVRFGGDRVEIRNLQLASGDQRVDADGVIGSPTEELRVRAEQVDVAELDELMLGAQRFAGRLNATADVFGPLDAVRAEGQFTLTDGGFRQFTFESLAGSVDYVRPGVNVNVRLQQSPQAWLTAKGHAPISLLWPNRTRVNGHETPANGEGIDLQISSSEIDLGLIQGFTPYLTNVTGALEANVRVTGTGRDPHFDGVIDVRGGAFAVPDLGTAYTGLNTRVDLTTDAVTIGEMRIVDERNQVMTVGGTLAVHEGAVGAVDVKVRSEGFEVVDNELAGLRLDTDIRVTGELRAPRIEGVVEVVTGNVDVARVLEETTGSFGTQTAGLDSAAPGAVDPAPAPPQSTLLEAVEVEVGVAVPGNLVLRGTDIRTANASFSIGDVNVTVGGALQVRKGPGAPPRLIGEINTIRGSYTFQRRRFEILRDGRIRFGGTEEIDPLLDLQARRIISGVETFVHVQGSMRQPELSLSSRPPLDEADILSLIVFNVPVNELGERQQVSLAERAGALAGGYIVSGLTQSLANALELDELEFQTQTAGGLGASLSIGEQIGEDLFVRIRRGFGAAEATELILEYQIAEFLRLQGSIAQTPAVAHVTFQRVERGGLDLIFFFSY